MALYQPSNITPSTFAGIGAGVIDAADNISISWQVNGTSAMTGYTITVYENTTASRQVWEYTSTSAFQPFYGTDAQGNPVFFISEPGLTWASQGLSNGSSYKMKITQRWKNNPDDSSEAAKTVVQTSESVFITRAAPSLSVSPASGTLPSVAQTFTASYSQAQGDAVSWVRWVLSDASGKVLDDTGTVYTGVLSYTYDSFFSGETYGLQCTVQTASGAEVTATNNYAVSYDMAEQSGGISLSCNPDDSVTLSWAAGADIPGVPSAQDYGTISGGVLHLAAERSITWNTVNGEDMAFSSPYCFAWRGRIAESATETQTVNSGTWELVKTYPQSNSTTDSHTMNTNAWTRNPGANDRANGTISVSVPVTSVLSRTSEEFAPHTTLTVIGSFDVDGNTYIYKSGTPATITASTPISSISENMTVYYSSYGSSDLIADIGAVAVANRVSDTTYEFTIYSTTPEAYNAQYVYVRFTAYHTVYTGTGYATPPSGRTGIEYVSLSGVPSNWTSSSGSWNGTRFAVTGTSYFSSTSTVTVNYTYAANPNNLYMATWTGTQAAGTLTSVSIRSTTAAGGATVSRSGNNYTVTEYSPNNTTATQTVVNLNYTTQTTGSDSYRTIVTGVKTGAVSASIQSTTATSATVTMGMDGIYTVTMYYSSNSSTRTATILFTIPTNIAMPNFAFLMDSNINSVRLTVTDSGHGNEAVLNISSERVAIPAPTGTWEMVAIVRPYTFETIWINSAGTVIGSNSATFTTPLPSPITRVSLLGPQNCTFTYISQDPNFDFSNITTNPGWDGNTLFYAAFASDLQAGTVTSDSSLSVAIYRTTGTAFEPVGVFGGTVKSIRDYGIRSGVNYVYEMFYISSGTYSAGAESTPLCRQFRQHTLIEAEEDASLPGVYHPVNVWRFRDNVDAGTYTNQNQPVLLENFTKYPLWQPSSPAAKAGTLTALLGRFENGIYSGDAAAAMDALFALSGSVNPLFYRDMKGNLYMVRLAGPISQTVDNRTGVLAVSVSVPWVEVGDAGDAKIYTEA